MLLNTPDGTAEAIDEAMRESVRRRSDALTPGWQWATVVVNLGPGLPLETIVVTPAGVTPRPSPEPPSPSRPTTRPRSA